MGQAHRLDRPSCGRPPATGHGLVSSISTMVLSTANGCSRMVGPNRRRHQPPLPPADTGPCSGPTAATVLAHDRVGRLACRPTVTPRGVTAGSGSSSFPAPDLSSLVLAMITEALRQSSRAL